jgi:hypothetical protein
MLRVRGTASLPSQSNHGRLQAAGVVRQHKLAPRRLDHAVGVRAQVAHVHAHRHSNSVPLFKRALCRDSEEGLPVVDGLHCPPLGRTLCREAAVLIARLGAEEALLQSITAPFRVPA